MLNIDLDHIWKALEWYRDNAIPDGVIEHDEEWDNICSQMAQIEEITND